MASFNIMCKILCGNMKHSTVPQTANITLASIMP